MQKNLRVTGWPLPKKPAESSDGTILVGLEEIAKHCPEHGCEKRFFVKKEK